MTRKECLIRRSILLLFCLHVGALFSFVACGPSNPDKPVEECKNDDTCKTSEICKQGKCILSDQDQDGFSSNKDCDDSNREVNPNTPEICDNQRDDNCNGQTDETPCSCKDGDIRECGTDEGECKKGTQTCVLGVWDSTCKGAVEAQEETCDGKDNNCDGQTDEDVPNCCQPNQTRSCGTDTGECTQGTQSCEQGQWTECKGEGKPNEEVCDGKDNDCDGKTDNIKNSNELLSQPCYDGDEKTKNVGECKPGKQYCEGGEWSKNCKGQTSPTDEDCNGKDDDCDGKVDNGKESDQLEEECFSGPPEAKGKGKCKSGRRACNAGQWSPCKGEVPPTQEDCNGKDDDCDGNIDNGKGGASSPLTQACYTGPTDTRGQGECKDGQQRCKSGKWETCKNDIQPKLETCDGKDNDCDGKTDNVVGTNDPIFKSCYNGPAGTENKGECKSGKQRCTNGSWDPCKGSLLPKTESCNGKDDDCNGKIDDGNPGAGGACNTGKSGPCGPGKLGCKDGKVQCIANFESKPEICNGKDDNCDGNIDENNPGGNRACNTGKQGVCSQGKTKCSNGTLSCEQTNQPSQEVCDGKDNNCNGSTDENLVRFCYSGSSGCVKRSDGSYNCNGKCRSGKSICSRGRWTRCSGEVTPKNERCNNQDDDCDGRTDEPWPSKGQPCSVGQGACKVTGTLRCKSDGSTTECSARPASASTERACNRIDDDCDGRVDEVNCSTGYQCSGTSCQRCIQPKSKTCVLGLCSCDLKCKCGYRCKKGAFRASCERP